MIGPKFALQDPKPKPKKPKPEPAFRVADFDLGPPKPAFRVADFDLSRTPAAQAADAAAAPFDELDRDTGLPTTVQLGLEAAGDDARRVAYLQSKGYQTTLHPEHGLLWYNADAGKWATPNKKGLDLGDVPRFARTTGELAGMGIGSAAAAGATGPAAPLGPAMAGSGVGLAAARMMMKPVFNLAARAAGEQVPDAPPQPLGSAVASGVGDVVGDVAEGAIAEPVARMLPALAQQRFIRRGVQKLFKTVTPAAEAAAKQGLPVTPETFAERGPTRIWEKFFRQSPVGGPMQQARQELLEATERRAAEIGDLMGPKGSLARTAEEFTQAGLSGYRAFRETLGAMDGAIDDAISARFPRVPEVANIEGALFRLERRLAQAPNTRQEAYAPILQRMRALVADVNRDPRNPGVPFEALRDLRSTLTDLSKPVPGQRMAVPRRLINEVEDALNADIGQVARRVGPDVEAQWAVRNQWVRMNRDSQNPVSWKKFMQAIDLGEEKGVLSYAERKNPISAARLRRLREMANQRSAGSWGIIAREQWDRLARDGPEGPFDPVRLIKNLERMPEDVRDAYWGGTGMGDALKSIEGLFPVFRQMQREGIKPPDPMGNPGSVSQARAVLWTVLGNVGGLGGTVAGATAGGAAGAAGGGVAGLAAMGGAGYSISRLFAWPAFGRWLRTTAEMAQRPADAAMERHLARLWAMAKTRQMVDEVRDLYEAAGITPPASDDE